MKPGIMPRWLARAALLSAMLLGILSWRVITSQAALFRAPAAASPPKIVISEFRSRGPGGATDEFIEIYNADGGPVDLSGWSLKKSSGCGTTTSVLATFPAGTILQPGQHYLIASESFTQAIPDLTYPTSKALADNGGIAILNPLETPVDQAGMCATTLFLEGTPLPPVSSNSDWSYERLPRSPNGNCTDTNDNFSDFGGGTISPSNPQNSAAPAIYCAGLETFTPTATPSPAPSPSDTPLPSDTPTPSDTPLPSDTPTPTPFLSPTPTPSP
ncbi:MAG: lamin tail domain-containing protein, partial [Chloroflexi bacterium]|nr:lamin tail domain-containing protein [Chloroflexota bacterium]